MAQKRNIYLNNIRVFNSNEFTIKKYKRTLSKEDSLTLKPTKVVYSKTNGEEKEYKFK